MDINRTLTDSFAEKPGSPHPIYRKTAMHDRSDGPREALRAEARAISIHPN
jgi:hypothetical protein